MCCFGRKEKQAKREWIAAQRFLAPDPLSPSQRAMDRHDGDRARLPDGFVRIGYDDRTQVNTYLDKTTDDIWEGAPGARYGDLKLAKKSPAPALKRPRMPTPPPRAVLQPDNSVDRRTNVRVSRLPPPGYTWDETPDSSYLSPGSRGSGSTHPSSDKKSSSRKDGRSSRRFQGPDTSGTSYTGTPQAAAVVLVIVTLGPGLVTIGTTSE